MRWETWLLVGVGVVVVWLVAMTASSAARYFKISRM
jgi:hypothetical protein